MINIGLGDKDAAFATLRKAIDERSPMLIWLNADPVYDDLHSDSRFTELLLRIGLRHQVRSGIKPLEMWAKRTSTAPHGNWNSHQ